MVTTDDMDAVDSNDAVEVLVEKDVLDSKEDADAVEDAGSENVQDAFKAACSKDPMGSVNAAGYVDSYD